MESIWSQSTEIQTYPTLSGDKKTEVVIIGGGLAGVLTAYFLQRLDIPVLLLEADRIGSGQTKNTTAKITSQHDLIYDKLIQDFGSERARQYAQANQEAIARYNQIITENHIDCNLEERPAYLYSTNKQDVKSLEQEVQAAKSLGIDAQFTKETNLPFSVAGAVRFAGQAQFHPLKFLKFIAQSLDIFEQTPVKSVEDNRVLTEKGIVEAKSIVFATHFPFINLPGFYFARMHQERSYVVALKNAAALGGMYLGVGESSLSFRNSEDLLLLGGGGHRTGENSSGGKYEMLRKKAAEFYPQSIETAHWSAQDCMPMDGVPYIGSFSSSTPNWYVATGFKKWGMSSSMVSAQLLTDLITKGESPYAPVFSPQRFTPSASVKLFVENSAQAVKGLSRQVFVPPKVDIDALPIGHGGTVDYEGEKLGVYKSEDGEVYWVSTRCPHLGCQVEWNPDEKSWDCPCHGSRFDYTGKKIEGPAQNDLESEDHA